MKKKILLLVVVLTVLGIVSCKKETDHYALEAKTISFESLEEMEEFSGVIVRGERQDGETPVIVRENGMMVSGYTFSDFKVTEIFKDSTNMLEKGSVITILENEIYDDEENEVYHIAGYNMMEEGKEYLLFLKKDTLNGSDYYVAAGVNYGTVSLEEDGRMVQRPARDGEPVTDFSYYEPIWEAAKEKYISD